MAGARTGERGRGALLVLTIVAAPAALAFETLLRLVIVPADFEQVRALLRPILTPVAWGLALVCALAGVGAISLHARAVRRAHERHGPADADARARARLGAFMLGASVPQVPAVLATFAYMFGADLLPVACALAVVTLAVLWLARRTRAA